MDKTEVLHGASKNAKSENRNYHDQAYTNKDLLLAVGILFPLKKKKKNHESALARRRGRTAEQ